MKRIIVLRLLSTLIKNTAKVAVVALPIAIFSIASTQAATMSETAVQSYADSMKKAANTKDMVSVAQLVSDDALISLSRRDKTTSLDKSAYLKLLQDSWNQTTNYHYDITINNIVTSGKQAKADVKTIESWVKDGKEVVVTTTARATLTAEDNNAILLRAVAQVTID